jgi:hypothetical protein
MRRGGQEEQVVGTLGELPRRTEVLRRRSQPVRLVEDGQRPARARTRHLPSDVLVVRVQVNRDYPDIDVGPQIQGVAARLRGDRDGLDTEEAIQIADPLDDDVCRHNQDRSAWQEKPPSRLRHVHPSHDRLAGTGLVGEQEAQPRLRQHRAEDRLVLMREGPKRTCGHDRRPDARDL